MTSEAPKPVKIETTEQWEPLKNLLSEKGANRVANALAHSVLYYRTLPDRIEFRRCDYDAQGLVLVAILPDAPDFFQIYRRLSYSDYTKPCGDCADCRKKGISK